MASRGRADWRGRGRGRGRASNSPNMSTYGNPAPGNYGIGRGHLPAEYRPSSQQQMPVRTEEKQTIPQLDTGMANLKPQLETGMANLNIQQVQGSAVLKGVTPDMEKHNEWNQHLTTIWTQGHQPQVLSRALTSFLQQTNDPYKTALYMTYKSPGFYTNKGNTLCMVVIKEFDQWLRNTGSASPVSKELKYLAYDIAFQQKNSELIKYILNVYQVTDESHLFLENVRYFVTIRKYREACIAATLLKLQHHFGIKEIIVPLMLQDSLCFVEDYLADNEEQQKAFLTFVDGLCAREAPIQPMLIEMSEVPDIKRDKCIPKIFRKLCTRLMKKFNVPPETCPNVAQGKNTGAVKYLMYKKYVEQGVDSEDWDELIEDAVRNDPASQKELILSLTCYNDIPCAVKYAQKFSIPTNELPISVQSAMKDNVLSYYEPIRRKKFNSTNTSNSASSSYRSDSWGQDEWGEVPEEYHQLSLPQSAILFVDDRTKFLSLLNHLSQDGNVIGIDGEWKPSFGANSSKLAVLQLATENTVYVLDTITLLDLLTDDEWLLFVKTLFCNSNIVKLGFGISSDFKMMAEILPAAASAAMAKRVNVVDLQTLSSMLYKTCPKIFPYELCDGGNGLTDLTKACLGKSLNKTDQFSNWERRPLRESQLSYAALDAFCLLEIYNILRRRADELNLDLDTAILSCTNSKPKNSKSASRTKQPAGRSHDRSDDAWKYRGEKNTWQSTRSWPG